jgi:2-C-methyl-D-erythritol 4-phosphate cytidylyltransferase / 2-C-methyl-D-erythritol 2,4-cyclodiphosphate synthase
VLEWTLEAFQNHPGVDSIVIVAGESDLLRVGVTAAQFSKVARTVAGGTTRAESVQNGLNAVPSTAELVLVHDAARPLISAAVIDRVIEGTARVGACVPGLPLSDTVKRTDVNGLVRATIPRVLTKGGETLSGLTAVQTPQGARVSLLRLAYDRYDFSQGEPTDEASLIEALGEPVQIVPGDFTNIKITRQEDLLLAEALGGMGRQASVGSGLTNAAQFESVPSGLTTDNTTVELGPKLQPSPPDTPPSLPEYRTGLGYDVHAFADPSAGRRLFLGGVEIPHDRGLEGHSDADVLLHAVCDALLGAASLGDIGILFPNTDDAYKGIASLRLLEVVAQRLREGGWRVVNVDVTVVAEAPRLMPHRDAMQNTMASCLGIEAERISVKATTSEKLGFVGRGEGMEATAIATLMKAGF